MTTNEKITSQHIRTAMLKQFGGSEWAIMWEVAPATGHIRGTTRYADAVMMSVWPSRGLDLHGVEIKVSRSDWKNEAKDPTKAERIAAYCDFWWVHVAPGCVHDISEVPTNWGLRELQGGKLKTIREATRRKDVLPCDREFLASLLRRSETSKASEIEPEVQKRIQNFTAQNEERIERAIREKTKKYDEALGVIKNFEEASGISMSGWSASMDAAEVGKLIKLFQEVGMDKAYNSVRSMVASLHKTSERLNKIIEDYDAGINPKQTDWIIEE